MELNRKGRGDLAELKVATDLLERGYKLALPYGEDWDFDLILSRGEGLERVQVKYVRSDGVTIKVRPKSQSLTNGKVRSIKLYTAETIDWLAVWDATSERCYYLPATVFGPGCHQYWLRLKATRNGQVRGTHPASDYLKI